MMGSLARTDDYDPMTGLPIGATVGEPKVTDYGQADLTPFAMGALAQHRLYQPFQGDIATGTTPWKRMDIAAAQADTPRSPTDLDPATNKWLGQQAADLAIPSEPWEWGLAAMGPAGRVAGKVGKAAALATGIYGSGVDEAEAGVGSKLGKAGRTLGSLFEQKAVPATGSLNPLDNIPVTFGGKQPKDFTPQDWQAFGQHHGVDNLGPLSPLQTYKDVKGASFDVPGGTEGNWTYYDLLHMKANPINPANVDRTLHAEMQRKLGRTMTPEADDASVWNGLIFGMTSPNNPLFPNQATASRLRLRTPEMLDDLSSSISWKAGDEVPAAVRKAHSDAIANRYGLGGAEKTGGLGTRGTADYTRIAELAQMFKQNPTFFRKTEDESWGQAVERISSQVPGLSMKTGSFGTVWQDPAHAAISAIDRHMARELEKTGGLFHSVGERHDWEKRSVQLWNKREMDRQLEEFTQSGGEVKRRANIAEDFDDLQKKSGSDGFMGEMLLAHVGDAANPKFRLASGQVNPAIPEHLANAAWVREPETVFKMGRAYKQALDLNQKLADENGLNLFMSQWMEWDRIRNRFEPHENMFPGLSRTPAMSIEQMREVDAAHRATGHKTYGKTEEGSLIPTRPLAGLPSKMGYLGIGGLVAPGAYSLYGDER